jgi:hypothetical protein
MPERAKGCGSDIFSELSGAQCFSGSMTYSSESNSEFGFKWRRPIAFVEGSAMEERDIPRKPAGKAPGECGRIVFAYADDFCKGSPVGRRMRALADHPSSFPFHPDAH